MVTQYDADQSLISPTAQSHKCCEWTLMSALHSVQDAKEGKENFERANNS